MAVYRRNCIVSEVAGSPVAEVSMDRQGCPLSGSLFALAPLLQRSMAHRLLASARLVAYANDLAAVLRRLRTELPQLRRVAMLGQGVGPRAEDAPVRRVAALGQSSRLRDILDSQAGLPGARVPCAAPDLGVTVGTDVRGEQWGRCVPSWRRGRRDVAACGAAWPTRLTLFAIHCTSLVRYKAQSDALLQKNYRAAVEHQTSFGLPAAIPPLFDVC